MTAIFSDGSRTHGDRLVAADGTRLARERLLTDANGHQRPEAVLSECGANLADIAELAELT